MAKTKQLDAAQITDLVEELRILGERVASARLEFSNAETDFRHWRAIATEDVSTRKSKNPEWKTKAQVESMQGYKVKKTQMNEAYFRVLKAETDYNATQVQAMLLAAMQNTNPAHWLTNTQSKEQPTE
jgi:hypothetical protein